MDILPAHTPTPRPTYADKLRTYAHAARIESEEGLQFSFEALVDVPAWTRVEDVFDAVYELSLNLLEADSVRMTVRRDVYTDNVWVEVSCG